MQTREKKNQFRGYFNPPLWEGTRFESYVSHFSFAFDIFGFLVPDVIDFLNRV
jgi:hypothetical protein